MARYPISMQLRTAPFRYVAPHIIVASDGSWFEVEGARRRVDLTARNVLRRILIALVELKFGFDAELSVNAAFDAGWPGERASRTAAATRVYTAIHSLRQLGLSGLLIKRRYGYVLNADVSIATFDEHALLATG